MTGRRGRRGKQLLDDLKEMRCYWKLRDETLDRNLWRNGFDGGYRPSVGKTTGLTNEWMNLTDVPQPPKNANVVKSKFCKVTESFLYLIECCEWADVSSLCSYSKNVTPNKVESWIPCSVIVCWCRAWYGQKSAQSIYCPINGALQVQGLLQLYIHKSVHPVTSLFACSFTADYHVHLLSRFSDSLRHIKDVGTDLKELFLEREMFHTKAWDQINLCSIIFSRKSCSFMR
jgi:hypothetical protein